ncbi:MAG: thiamine biosynthesis lipoprotein precursor [Acidimicrobiales bacterium]|nr:thiamine biosynthesis lipoprotein precursor [Acidimicrobiales bacterium]
MTKALTEALTTGAADRTFRVEHLWGTAIGVDVRGPVREGALDAVFSWFARVDDLFSTWRADTEISRLGRGELTVEQASPEVRTVLDLCRFVELQSGGAFDVTFGSDPRVTPQPGRGPIDPSGLVKGWALDRAAGLLVSEGVSNFTINAGGDVVTHGRPAPGEMWRVGIQHPSSRDQLAAVVGGTDLAVATSGRYERGDHIIDPRTGRPAVGLVSVTVIGDDLALADGYATAALVLGRPGMVWLDGLAGAEGMAITGDGTVLLTDGFDRFRIS